MPRSVDYSKGLIYKICCKDPNIKDIYIGSTTNLNQRRREHKCHCNNENSKSHNLKVYKFIRDNGGWNNWDMVMVKEFSCENKRQLEAEERKQLEELNATLNINIPTRTRKEYREENKEKFVEKTTEWRKNNLNYRLKYEKEYYIKNKGKKNEYDKEYYTENKQKLCEKSKEYRLKNKQKIAEKIKEYRLKNKQKIAEKTKEYRLENKQKIAKKGKEKIECDICKCKVRKSDFKRHTRTLKHQNNIDN